ncbi:MAG: four helix bundle protein [Bacteroidetes bacterium]|jgi:four helix bundle protein|nr:four helix bundle protein [Bacteroidota bacterium]MBT5531306.1 four helix bundle protein [Cytophagia bacterium]MBT3423557.1 four helix bundle protein [Bacteroidota bacterium]MBT3802478.1 four helix bundle protein [Bacteroidota bacterium]MBT3933480.1 four helix bundle protein [Bacteroidota bacterium]
MAKYLSLEDLSSYKLALELSNYVWDIVVKWEYFEKKTVGEQFVRAADSISANIAEGFGRYGKKDKIKFYRYSLGSLSEVSDWIAKSIHRKLITEKQEKEMLKFSTQLPIELYNLINFTNEKLKI